MDTAIGSIITGTQEEFEQRTGWGGYFVAQSATFYYTLSNQDKVVFDMPVISVSALSLDGTSKTENTDFWLTPANGTRKYVGELAGVISTAQRGAVVTGYHGYALACPTDVNIAIAECCLAVLRDRQQLISSVPFGQDFSKIKQGPVEIETSLASSAELAGAWSRTPSFKAICERYLFQTPY